MERSTNQTDHNLRRHVVTEAMMVALACRKVCPGLSGSAFSLRILCQSNAWIADEIWEIKAPGSQTLRDSLSRTHKCFGFGHCSSSQTWVLLDVDVCMF